LQMIKNQRVTATGEDDGDEKYWEQGKGNAKKKRPTTGGEGMKCGETSEGGYCFEKGKIVESGGQLKTFGMRN